jgi:outer membrane lipoprotein carrier protein
MRVSRFAAAVVLAAGLVLPAAGQTPSAAEVAASLQKKYDSIRDFSADFVHNYEGGVLRKTLKETGSVQILKPGRMRWLYTSPQKKQFVSDGRKVYIYVPADRQVIVSDVPQADQATSAVLFLAGKGNLTRDFTVSFAAGAPADAYALKLLPKVKESDYEWLEVVVDKTTFQIRALSFEDKGGRSTFRFSNFKENTGLAEKIFAFKIPAGVDVISNAPAHR